MQLEGDVIKTPPTQKSMRAIWNGVTSILLPAGVFMYWPYMVPVLGYSVPSLLAVMATYHGVNKFFQNKNKIQRLRVIRDQNQVFKCFEVEIGQNLVTPNRRLQLTADQIQLSEVSNDDQPKSFLIQTGPKASNNELLKKADSIIDSMKQNIPQKHERVGPSFQVQGAVNPIDEKTLQNYKISDTAIVNQKIIWSFKHPNLVEDTEFHDLLMQQSSSQTGISKQDEKLLVAPIDLDKIKRIRQSHSDEELDEIDDARLLQLYLKSN